MCAGLFSNDNQWYRAEVVGLRQGEGTSRIAQLYFIDYGNEEEAPFKPVSSRLTLGKNQSIDHLHNTRVCSRKISSETFSVSRQQVFESYIYFSLSLIFDGCRHPWPRFVPSSSSVGWKN